MKAILIAILATTAFASARIGETREQCIERYGKIIDEKKTDNGDQKCKFKKGSFQIWISFSANIAYELAYIKVSPEDTIPITKMTSEEAWSLLNKNGTDWSIIDTKDQKVTMITKDHSKEAYYVSTLGYLNIVRLAERDKAENKKATIAEKELDGF